MGREGELGREELRMRRGWEGGGRRTRVEEEEEKGEGVGMRDA